MLYYFSHDFSNFYFFDIKAKISSLKKLRVHDIEELYIEELSLVLNLFKQKLILRNILRCLAPNYIETPQKYT